MISISLLLVFSTCKRALKDVKDYYPKVETVSATVLGNGSVRMTGRLLKDGESEVTYYGFCMSKQPIPALDENQISIEKRSTNDFEGLYKGFDKNTKYYFRAWANNEFGYSFGEVIELNSIEADTIAPCTPELDKVNIEGQNIKESYIDVYSREQSDYWMVSGKANSHHDFLFFKDRPVTGSYKVVTSFDEINDYTVLVEIRKNNVDYTLDKDSKVYVKVLKNDRAEVTICKAPFTYVGSPSRNYLTLRMNYYQ